MADSAFLDFANLDTNLSAHQHEVLSTGRYGETL
jgi:hypothetical protein